MKLYEKVYDNDAYIEGFVISIDKPNNRYLVLWKNNNIGTVMFDDTSVVSEGFVFPNMKTAIDAICEK